MGWARGWVERGGCRQLHIVSLGLRNPPSCTCTFLFLAITAPTTSSIKVSDDEKLDKAGIICEDQEYLVESLACTYLKKFHANKFSLDP
jgi:hypothetical protein